jgi:hypoxanthine-DNA glycosylase
MTGRSEELVHPFPPLYDASSRILILGSFPSAVSRQQSFYYANATNRFWPIMEAVFETPIEDRRQFCLDRHIALWDVIYSCRIKGSSDASISDVKVNDIQKLIDETKIHTVFTTGAKAAKLYDEYVVCDAEHIALPSTSAANARMKLNDLAEEYAILREKLYER